MNIRTSIVSALSLILTVSSLHGTDWRPVEGHLLTRWAKEVSAGKPWPDYPRPQMRREQWVNLNGLWNYSITERSAPDYGELEGKILVPFAIESALSGVKKAVLPEQTLWYQREFEVPAGWRGKRVLLNFGAVDWEAVVFVNGIEVGRHRGGYTPCSFDITRALRAAGEQELVVRVWDPTNQGTQPRGKQVLAPEGIWYTAVTGIWQTVWLEPVPEISITRLNPVPDIDNEELGLRIELSSIAEGLRVRAVVRDGPTEVARAEGDAAKDLEISISNAKLWSPDAPNLYDLRVQLLRGGRVLDEVESYFGMRKIALGRDSRGDLRLFLNNQALFHLGPLDQGWWPDGLYTAPTDEALRYDIAMTRKLGFNMARKHVKVEPARWYYHCDQLGLMVWQDMPSGYLGGRGPGSLFVAPWDEKDATRDGVSAAQFEAELKEMIDAFGSFTSIVMWVPFNEGWGQYDTKRIADWVKQYDPSRLVNAVSGWTDRGAGDVYDTHMYPGPGMQKAGPDRAMVLGEFGGLGWPVPDHLWWDKRNWGYRTYQSREELARNYAAVYHNLRGPWGRGVAAAIYTQTTDVEGEVNGLMTYDREIVKFDTATMQGIHEAFYGEPPRPAILMNSSVVGPQPWRYTFQQPSGEWASPSYDDNSWSNGDAPFRSAPDPDFPNGTTWSGGSIWCRRIFTVTERPQSLWLEVWHNLSEGQVYLNGMKVAELSGGTRREYGHRDVSEALEFFKIGKNVIAVHAEARDSDRGRRGDMDVGLYRLE